MKPKDRACKPNKKKGKRRIKSRVRLPRTKILIKVIEPQGFIFVDVEVHYCKEHIALGGSILSSGQKENVPKDESHLPRRSSDISRQDCTTQILRQFLAKTSRNNWYEKAINFIPNNLTFPPLDSVEHQCADQVKTFSKSGLSSQRGTLQNDKRR